MQRLWIHHVLPAVFAAIPVLGAVLVFAAIPADARNEYLSRASTNPIDWVIIGLGISLFSIQTILVWKALRWNEHGFNERPDRWLTHLAQTAEWFPLLGLLGTVAAILQTFTAIPLDVQPNPREIIRNYGPAITATGSGLFMALVNILPAWIVVTGRDLIRSLAGDATPMVPLTPASTFPPESETRGRGMQA
ncbi:MAG: MotA/TolQ/ExbB proton channel family protein [Bacteroidales bacterium]|nr:MotA/TolQ/ExbB proton channel family protein [Bacteroidales bacterium]